ncbi:GntP family permease [Flavihumibacter rivuli]|uniref:GntP family permease n=1 Tax=Flavihumibacter rivuli TaxID=2838156 RepID=UPI001BDED0D5|nr:GntP family permease [Flavihumibacter rivuli]ULQ55791.1 GntP family permease [Flavihumibacter rivuli]
METSFLQVMLSLLAGVLLIVWLTARIRLHPFFALFLAALLVGWGVGIPTLQVLDTMRSGFGHIMQSLGFIIVLGTALGILLEKTGSATVMATHILQWIGPKFATLAMAITGYVVGLPIFCDSGFIVLSGLNKSVAIRTAQPIAVMSVAMAAGLYSVHCLIPPHPGAAAAAGIIGADYGKLVIVGMLLAIPAMYVGYRWALYAGKGTELLEDREEKAGTASTGILPPAWKAFLPVLLPILLLTLRSILYPVKPASPGWKDILYFTGEPVIALAIALLLTIGLNRGWRDSHFNYWLQESAEKAGGILVIIGAGGAFGAVLAATHLGEHLGARLPLESLGIFFPFLVTSLLKTAQGSSTVAIITAASLVQPLLPQLGLESPDGRLYTVLAMGAGSMMVSHANDAYFWVIAKFQQVPVHVLLKVYTIASILMGLVSFLLVWLVSSIWP